MNSKNQILVVDDDPAVLRATSKILTDEGYHVIEASNGLNALQLARTNFPDLILLDNELPDISGLEVCKRLKDDSDTTQIFISMLSGTKISSSDQSNGLDIGADEYIIRPIGNRELLSRVKAMLRLRNTEKELKEYQENLEEMIQERTKALQIGLFEAISK